MSDFKAFVMALPSSVEIQNQVDVLRNEKNRLIPDLGWLVGTINNSDQSKIDNSYSGHAVDHFSMASAQLLVLGLMRIWDKDGDRVLTTLQKIQNISNEIELKRHEVHPEWPSQALEVGFLESAIASSMSRASELINSKELRELRVFRTENLAHFLDGQSRDRERLNLSESDVSPTFNQVVSAAHETVEIIDRIISHWEFHIENSNSSIDLQAKYARMFWNALPKLSDAEDSAFLS